MNLMNRYGDACFIESYESGNLPKIHIDELANTSNFLALLFIVFHFLRGYHAIKDTSQEVVGFWKGSRDLQKRNRNVTKAFNRTYGFFLLSFLIFL